MYSIQNQITRLAGSAALVALTTAGWAPAQTGAYIPTDGLVVVEMEALAEGAGWSGASALSGFAGEGYVAWKGPDMSKTPVEGRSRTWAGLTPVGKKAFAGHVAELNRLAALTG